VDNNHVADERDRKLVERYDAHAVAYQALWAPTLRLASVHLVRELAGRPVRRVIDVGTGVGALWSDLRTAFPEAFLLGFDHSSGMLRLAPPEMARAVADARSLPLPSASVDLALLVFMLFHLADPIVGIREARRVVRPGGYIGTVTWGTDLASPATLTWTGCLNEHGAAPPDPITQARDELLNSPEKMDALLRAGGFETIRVWADDLVTAISLEHLLQLKTRMGSEKARFDSLPAAAQAVCLANARQRLQMLPPADFAATGKIVYALAS
jgi:ubiquinone/menaquinone biosynthesis C-methylase UbiE